MKTVQLTQAEILALKTGVQILLADLHKTELAANTVLESDDMKMNICIAESALAALERAQ